MRLFWFSFESNMFLPVGKEMSYESAEYFRKMYSETGQGILIIANNKQSTILLDNLKSKQNEKVTDLLYDRICELVNGISSN